MNFYLDCSPVLFCNLIRSTFFMLTGSTYIVIASYTHTHFCCCPIAKQYTCCCCCCVVLRQTIDHDCFFRVLCDFFFSLKRYHFSLYCILYQGRLQLHLLLCRDRPAGIEGLFQLEIDAKLKYFLPPKLEEGFSYRFL